MITSSKAVLGFLLLLSTKAYSKNALVNRDLLNENDIDPISLEQLLKEKLLLPSTCPEFFIVNEKK